MSFDILSSLNLNQLHVRIACRCTIPPMKSNQTLALWAWHQDHFPPLMFHQASPDVDHEDRVKDVMIWQPPTTNPHSPKGYAASCSCINDLGAQWVCSGTSDHQLNTRHMECIRDLHGPWKLEVGDYRVEGHTLQNLNHSSKIPCGQSYLMPRSIKLASLSYCPTIFRRAPLAWHHMWWQFLIWRAPVSAHRRVTEVAGNHRDTRMVT